MTRHAATSRNATKSGIFAAILLSGEAMGERETDYRRLRSGLLETFRPASVLGEILVDKLAFLYLRLSRLYKADVRLADKIFDRVGRALEADSQSAEAEYVGESKEFKLVTVPSIPSPELLIKYESNIERQIGRTLEQLERERTQPRPPASPSGGSGTGAGQPE